MMKKRIYNYLIVSIITIALTTTAVFAGVGADIKPIKNTNDKVVSSELADQQVSEKQKGELENFFKNYSKSRSMTEFDSYSNPTVDDQEYIKVYYPDPYDVYHLDDSMFVDYDVFDTWVTYFTLPATGVFDSDGNLISYVEGEVAEVDEWTNYTGERYFDSDEYSNGSYEFMIFAIPCYSNGTAVDGWSDWDNIPVVSVPFKINHIWEDEYTIDKAATYTAKGKKSIHCEVCGAVKAGSTVTIAKKTVKATTISKLTAGKKSFTVKWKKKSGVTGYQIEYSLKKNFSNSKKLTIKGASKTSKKISKLKAKKKYYVRVRAYKTYKGKKYYSKWSKKKTVTTK